MMKWNEWTRSITKSNDLICTVRMNKLGWIGIRNSGGEFNSNHDF